VPEHSVNGPLAEGAGLFTPHDEVVCAVEGVWAAAKRPCVPARLRLRLDDQYLLARMGEQCACCQPAHTAADHDDFVRGRFGVIGRLPCGLVDIMSSHRFTSQVVWPWDRQRVIGIEC
jgi:hypothetical protein